MQTSLPANLNDVLSSAERWRVDGDVLTILSPSGGHFHPVVVMPLPALARLHPEAPGHLNSQLYWTSRRHGRDHVYGDEMRPILDYLMHGGVEFYSKETDETHIFSHVRQLVCPSDNDKQACLLGTEIAIHTSLNETLFPHPVFTSFERDYWVDKDELESRYPGWEERWRVGTEIGVELDALMRYVFSETATPGLSMTEVSFD